MNFPPVEKKGGKKGKFVLRCHSSIEQYKSKTSSSSVAFGS